MTNNNGYEDHKLCKIDRDCTKCKPKHPKPKNVLLECGEGTGSRTFTSSGEAPFQIANVTIDTTCLNRPEVLIKFSSLVSMEVLDDNGTVRLKYELFRVCDSGEPISLGLWMFEKVDVSLSYFNNIEESFSFIFCECLNCPGCFEYFVTVSPIEITNATATVDNGRLAALSQSLCDSWEEYKVHDLKNKDTKLMQKLLKPKAILLECGQGTGDIVFRDLADPSTNIAHVTIDTTCLSRPEVLIDFSSIIKIDEGIIDIVLEFELFRVCDDGKAISRGIWNFERIDINSEHGLDETFSFIFCECLTCPGCCDYFVTVTVLEIDLRDDSGAVVSVGNGRMTALAQSSKDCRYYDNHESCDEKYDCISCQSKHPKPKKILLECGSGAGIRTFTSSSDQPFQLANASVDTTCLCKPKVNIEFSSIVSFERVIVGTSGFATLRYELFRACNNKGPISLGVWLIDRRQFGGFQIEKATNIFDFTFCDCVNCPSCCDYFVTVTPVAIDEGDIRATVSNGRMAVLAEER